MNRKPLAIVLAASLILGLASFACSDDDGGSSSANGFVSPGQGITAVERQVLQSAKPTTATGQLLELTRVIIPAGQSIASHIHPGFQLAMISEGTLTYTVNGGQVTVNRAAGTAAAKTETVNAGQTVEVHAGDSIQEAPGMIHTAKNVGSGPVVIYLSSLFPEGAAPSSPAP